MIDAAQWQTTSIVGVGRRDRLGHVAAQRAGAAAVRRRVVVERGQDAVEPLLRGGVVGRADEAQDLVVAALEQPREHLHAEEAGRAGEEDRERSSRPAGMPGSSQTRSG